MATLIKRMMACSAIVLVCWGVMPAAQAGPWDRPAAYEGDRAARGAQGADTSRQNDPRRASNQRDDRREAPRPQRLSPDERRQLRQDIRDAGRDIYPARR